jgi:hypothetical protein
VTLVVPDGSDEYTSVCRVGVGVNVILAFAVPRYEPESLRAYILIITVVPLTLPLKNAEKTAVSPALNDPDAVLSESRRTWIAPESPETPVYRTLWDVPYTEEAVRVGTTVPETVLKKFQLSAKPSLFESALK